MTMNSDIQNANDATVLGDDNSRELGIQPINDKLIELGLDNHALVAASTEQLTHKMVAKARSGRWLSMKIRLKILRAFNKATKSDVKLADLFTY